MPLFLPPRTSDVFFSSVGLINCCRFRQRGRTVRRRGPALRAVRRRRLRGIDVLQTWLRVHRCSLMLLALPTGLKRVRRQLEAMWRDKLRGPWLLLGRRDLHFRIRGALIKAQDRVFLEAEQMPFGSSQYRRMCRPPLLPRRHQLHLKKHHPE